MAVVTSERETVTKSDLKLELTQFVKASPQRVFEAWLDPKLLTQWIGPRSMVESVEAVVLEPRVGGRWHLRTHMKPGFAGPCGTGGVGGVYKQIDRFTCLAFTWTRDGEPQTLVTVTFEPRDGGTLLKLTHEGFADQTARDQHALGWGGSMPQLADLAERRLVLRQQVNAPPARVFEALLDPALVCRWMGPRTMVQACEVMTLEPRLGGRYRFKMVRRPDVPHGGRPATLFVTGAYQQIEPPTRLAFSWMWEDEPAGAESRVAFELRPKDGGTEVTLMHEGFASDERREGHAIGWTASLRQMAEVLGG